MNRFPRPARFAALAASLGLEVHAGHGIDYETVSEVAAIPEVTELNIGHFLIGEAIFTGLDAAIRRMRALMDAARGEADFLMKEAPPGKVRLADTGLSVLKGLAPSSVLEPMALLYERTRQMAITSRALWYWKLMLLMPISSGVNSLKNVVSQERMFLWTRTRSTTFTS